MKGKLLIFMAISFCCANHILAQRFEIPFPQKSDKFTKAFVTALNNAPNKFVKLKGSLIFRYDSIHKQSKVYKCNLNIPGANAARYIEDSTYYLEYFFGEYSNLDEATGAMNALTAKLQTSLSDRAVVIMNKKGWDKLIKENKIGYVYQLSLIHI